MSLSVHISEKAALIWAIADKLTGVYKPHEYGEVILPLTVIRRFDCILADTKDAVLEKFESVKNLPMRDVLLRNASGKAFYNTSKFTFERLLDDPDNIEANFRDYLNGFSENVQDILEKFRFDGQITTMANKGILYIVIKEFTTPKANLHPEVISNLEMGYIFEEIIRRFSESHNEDAGQHYTPREVIQLMVNILFYDDNDMLCGNNVVKTLYDGACGTGGMLTVAQDRLNAIAAQPGKKVSIHLFGQEINPETYAIAKADMMLKGDGEEALHIAFGSTLSSDQHATRTFDFMLANPPYGKSWKTDADRMATGKKKEIVDTRFNAATQDGAPLPMIPRSSDGQLLFLLNNISKMKQDTPLGSRIVEVHNGSSLFIGDAGSGESNARRYMIENDLVEAIIALPEKMFYNTGIGTYIWVLSNRKEARRRGKIQLIDATGIKTPLRKNMGEKNCELSPEQRREIVRIFMDFEESEVSRIFPNSEFGYWKVSVHQPLLDAQGNPVLDKKGRVQPDKEKSDTEIIPFGYAGGIDGFMESEVRPYAPGAYIDPKATKVGYELSFTKYFYKPVQLRSMEEIVADLRALEQETNGMLAEILGGIQE